MYNITKEELKSLLIRAFEEGFCGYRDLRDDLIETLLKEVEDSKSNKVMKYQSFNKNNDAYVNENNNVHDNQNVYISHSENENNLHVTRSDLDNVLSSMQPPKKTSKLNNFLDYYNNYYINVDYAIPPLNNNFQTHYNKKHSQAQVSFEVTPDEILNIFRQSYEG